MGFFRGKPAALERGLCEGVHQDELVGRDQFERFEGLHKDAAEEDEFEVVRGSGENGMDGENGVRCVGSGWVCYFVLFYGMIPWDFGILNDGWLH